MPQLRLCLVLGGAALAATACGDSAGGSTDIQPTLRLADRSDLELQRLINAAAGTDMFVAQAQVDRFGDTFDPDPCPQLAISGATVTATGGCTRLDGTRVDGRATIDNPLGWDQLEYVYGKDSHYQLEQLTFTPEGGGDPQVFDGFLDRTDSMTTWDADLTVTSSGLAVRSDLYFHCTDPANPVCELTNSGLELPGVGGVTATGRVTLDRSTNRQTMDFALHGQDTLTIHSDGTCVAWHIVGTSRGTSCP